jgi:hypothetical protein
VVNIAIGMRTAAQVLDNVALHAQEPAASVWNDRRDAGLLEGSRIS